MKTILVTGATDGIGRQTALDLARQGHHVIAHGRDKGKVEATVTALLGQPGVVRVSGAVGDFASLPSVRALADDLAHRLDRLDVLVNNAGIYAKALGHTRDGFEQTFGVNHLAPFLLTHLLLDLLGAASSARVVNVSSVAHTRGTLDFDDLQAESGFSPYATYALSKLCNVCFTVELARRLGPQSTITVNALHPGVVSTKLLKEGFGMQGQDSLEDGAATSVFLATDPSVATVTGQYYADRRVARMNPVAQDRRTTARLYARSCEMVGIDGLPAQR